MKNLFSRLPASPIPATNVKREEIAAFIIEALKPYVDEKGLSVAGLHFYILCTDQEQVEAAQVALYADKPGLFKTEHLERKLVNHFIQLAPGWTFDFHLVPDQLPGNCLQQGNFGVQVIRSGERVTEQLSKARLEVLVGQAEHATYLLDPQQQLKYYIGRSKAPQLPSGKIQRNDIVFLAKDEAGFDEVAGKANLHISRNHAYILYEPRLDRFFLYPDKGGLPDNGNKTKVHTAGDKIKWLNIYGIGHLLEEGDQVELGGEAVLLFRLGAE